MGKYRYMPLSDNVEEMFIGPFGSSLKNESFVDEDEAFCMVYEQKHAIKKTMNVETRYINCKKYEELKRFNIKGGDIIVSCRGTIGETFIVPDDAPLGIMHPSIMKIRLKPGVYNKHYFNMLLRNYLKCHEDEANGSGIKMAISAKELGSALFPVPDMADQNRIALAFNRVEELINLRKAQLAKLDELVKARFVEMFWGISDSKRYPYKAVRELTDVISGGTPSREVSEYWEGGNIPWVKTTELQNNIITEIDEHITEAGLDNSSAKLVPAGTVLIAMYGQGKTRGMTGYLGVDACTNQACACILPSDSINQKFLWQFFMLSYDNLRDMAKGGNQPNLNGNIIKNYPVLYPPMELQEQFAAFVEQTNKTKLTIQASLDKLEVMKKALMQEYFG